MDEFRRMTPEEEQQFKRRKTLKSAIIVCSIVMIVLICLMLFLQAQDAKTFKLFVDNNPNPISVSGAFIISENGESYIAAEEFANIIGYRYRKGSYGSFSQNEQGAAYMQNDYEVAAFSTNSNVLKKYIDVDAQLDPKYTGITVLSQKGYSETTTLELNIIEKNGIIYICK